MKRRLALAWLVCSFAIWGSGCAPSVKTPDRVLTVWHWMSDRENVFLELADRYEKETGTRVRFELFAPSEAYAQRVKASAQTGTLPDIFGVLGEKYDFAALIKAGHIGSLTPALDAKADGGPSWRQQLLEKPLAVNEFLPGNPYGVTPGVYGIPLDATTIQMLYNKDLYAKAGLDPEEPPRTWEEFLGHCSILKEAGVPGLVAGFGEIWMIDALAQNFAMNLMGQEKLFATYRGDVPYTDPDWVKVLMLFKQMADRKIIVGGSVTMVNKSAEQTFANGRAAFTYNGSWSVNVFRGMNPDLNYGVILPPAPDPSKPMRIWGGAGTSFMVNAKSSRKEEAIRFLRWLTEERQQTYLADITESLPANKASVRKVHGVLAQYADDLENATHPNLYPVHENMAVMEAFDKGIQSIIIGEKKPVQVAEEVQRIKEKERSKQ